MIHMCLRKQKPPVRLHPKKEFKFPVTKSEMRFIALFLVFLIIFLLMIALAIKCTSWYNATLA